ncbi:hypothetical protein GCM10011339_35760 [Echinicola rosea]|uniref:Uncharacterized protein n=1 Tax=Echinicola rosea TaxID=1807691 RepID=A0ABQ1V8T6_9BACT|nr:hypothetical protein GCM10011339_35760 [Echinicola rosea]
MGKDIHPFLCIGCHAEGPVAQKSTEQANAQYDKQAEKANMAKCGINMFQAFKHGL